MNSVACLAQTLQTLLTTTAEQLAASTGCLRRHRKLSGATRAPILVLGWLHQPTATVHPLAQLAATLGGASTPQAIDRRFTEETATFLKPVLAAAVTQVLASDPVAIPLVRRFPAVMIQDRSMVVWPTALATTGRGCGSADPQAGAAAVKLHVRLDVVSGALPGPVLQDGRVHDRKASAQTVAVPSGALRLADLGSFSLERFQPLSLQGEWWPTRWPAGTVVLDATGRPLDVVAWLRARGTCRWIARWGWVRPLTCPHAGWPSACRLQWPSCAVAACGPKRSGAGSP
jgi:hypothetical protein